MEPTPMTTHPTTLSQRTLRMRSSAIREMLAAARAPGMVSLAGGNPAPESFPVHLFQDLMRDAFEHHGANALQYSETEGFMPLRRSLSQYLGRNGLPVDETRLLVTHGSQSVLDLLGKVLLDEGSPIAVESPTYLGALQAFAPYGPRWIVLDCDEQGATPDSLHRTLVENPGCPVYLMPTFQNPTGRSMGQERRRQVADLIRRHCGLLIEDDPYSALRYQGETLAPISAQCPENAVYLGTLSKVFAPGMRLGYCSAPAWLFPWLVKAKQGTDLNTSTFAQALATEYLDGGHLERQLPLIRALYVSRRDAMQAALQRYMPAEMSWTVPEGGMFFWVNGSQGFDAGKLLARALPLGVAFVAGDAFSCAGDWCSCMRLNFTLPSETAIFEGIRRIGQALEKTENCR